MCFFRAVENAIEACHFSDLPYLRVFMLGESRIGQLCPISTTKDLIYRRESIIMRACEPHDLFLPLRRRSVEQPRVPERTQGHRGHSQIDRGSRIESAQAPYPRRQADDVHHGTKGYECPAERRVQEERLGLPAVRNRGQEDGHQGGLQE